MSPRRIQRKRSKGWRMPEGAVYVGRPSKWGNPFLAKGIECSRSAAVEAFLDMLTRAPVGDGRWGQAGETVHDTIRRELAGRDLACWCPLDAPCHADVLLKIANGEWGQE
jgi:hypothetical protein